MVSQVGAKLEGAGFDS
jgi:hypothetical protein